MKETNYKEVVSEILRYLEDTIKFSEENLSDSVWANGVKFGEKNIQKTINRIVEIFEGK